MTRKYPTLFHRLLANTKIPEGQSETSGCWVWTGKSTASKRSGNRYPRINMWLDGKHKTLFAHRVMLATIEGVPIQTQEEPDHLCHNTMCVNPDHLERVHHLVNKKRIRRNKS